MFGEDDKMKYRMQAMDKQGKDQEVSVEGSSSQDAFEQVRQQGLFPVSVIETIDNAGKAHEGLHDPKPQTEDSPERRNLPILFWFCVLGSAIWLFMTLFASGSACLSFLNSWFRLLGVTVPGPPGPGSEERARVACIILFVLFSSASFTMWAIHRKKKQ
jgi:hypothetical protein